MPLYEYQCRACDKRFEVLQKPLQSGPVFCKDDKCDGVVERVMSTFAMPTGIRPKAGTTNPLKEGVTERQIGNTTIKVHNG